MKNKTSVRAAPARPGEEANENNNELPEVIRVLDSIGDGIVVTDSRGYIIFANSAAKDYISAEPQLAPSLLLRNVFNVQPPARPLPTPRVFSHNKQTRQYRNIIIKTSKRVITAEASLAPLFDDSKKIRGSVFHFRDVSSRIAEERVALEREKMEALGILAQGISSEITNWLGAISNHASAILDSLIPKTRAHDEAQHILSIANQAGIIAKRLQSIARASNLSNVMQISAVSVNEIVDDAINLVEASLRHHNISISVRHSYNKLHASADPALLLDCLVNLLLNAADALDDSGGSITVDVSLTTASSKRYVLIRVRDNGRGIPRQIQDKIFQPFFTTKKTSEFHAGLGLSIVKSSVEKWGGFIKLRTQVGRGTTFKIFIPFADVAAAQHVEDAHARGATILVVDDDSELLKATSVDLQRAGFKVLEASNADDALARYRQNQDSIQALVIDMILSGKDGKYLLSEILRLDPTARVVVTSGFCKDFVRSYLQRGAWLFLQKPYDSEQLVAVVRRALEQKTPDHRDKPATG